MPKEIREVTYVFESSSQLAYKKMSCSIFNILQTEIYVENYCNAVVLARA